MSAIKCYSHKESFNKRTFGLWLVHKSSTVQHMNLHKVLKTKAVEWFQWLNCQMSYKRGISSSDCQETGHLSPQSKGEYLSWLKVVSSQRLRHVNMRISKRNLHFLGFFFRFHVGFNKVPVFLIWNQHHIPRTWIFCLKATKACPRCKSNKFNNTTDLQLPSPKNVNVKIHCVLLSIYQHKSHVIHQLLAIRQWSKKKMVRTCKKNKTIVSCFVVEKSFFWEQTLTVDPRFLAASHFGASALGFLRLSIRPSFEGWVY